MSRKEEDASVLAELRRLEESIEAQKAAVASATRGRGSFHRGRGRGRGTWRGAMAAAPSVVHRNASWVAPGQAGTSRPAVAPVAPVGGFRNRSLVFNGATPSPSTSGASTPVPHQQATVIKKVVPEQVGKEVVIDGVTFISDPKRHRLVRKTGEASTSSESTPTKRSTSISGTRYIRTKSGNLVSIDFAKKKKDKAMEEKKERLDRLVGIVKGVQGARDAERGGAARGRGRGGLVRRPVQSTKLCKFFQKTGVCGKGLTCPYTHDSTRVAICPLSLKNRCPNSASSCPLSHTPNAHRSPHCTHFPNCRNGINCPYSHVHVSRDAGVCAAFVGLGWCEKGAECEERHVWECKRFSEEGVCTDKSCKLPHVLRRRNTEAITASKDDVDMEDDEPSDLAADSSQPNPASSVKSSTKRRADDADGYTGEGDGDREYVGISGATRKRGRFGDLAQNDDYVELFVPADAAGEEDSDEDDVSSVDSADLDDRDLDGAQLTVFDEPEAGRGDDGASEVEEDDYERRYDDEEDDEDENVARMLRK
ncbi:hypothetical protein T439DRAFT_327186 [Meredithblackwellia eburnea MCA 4105]